MPACKLARGRSPGLASHRGLQDPLRAFWARHPEPHLAPPDLDGEVEKRAAQPLQRDVLRQRDQHALSRRVPEGVAVFQFPRLVVVLSQPAPQRPVPLSLPIVHRREVAGDGRFALAVSRFRLHALLLSCPSSAPGRGQPRLYLLKRALSQERSVRFVAGGMTIGEVARKAGIRPSALRYYESVDILPKPERVNGRRRYDGEVLREVLYR